MPTSARWEVANLPQISVKPVHSAGGQNRPPLQERAGDVVGADDSVGPKNITNSPRIPVKPVQSARADVGIGPYNEIWWCTRGCIGLCFSPLPAATPQSGEPLFCCFLRGRFRQLHIVEGVLGVVEDHLYLCERVLQAGKAGRQVGGQRGDLLRNRVPP